MQRKILLMFFVFILSLFTVSAVPVQISSVEVNDVSLSPNSLNRLDVERGDNIDIRVVLTGTESMKNVEVEAFVAGFEFNDVERVSDSTGVFDVVPNVTYVKHLSIPLPDSLEKDDYKLRIMVSDRNNNEVVQSYNLKIDLPRHLVRVKDILLTPENEITAGGSLLAAVRVENLGARDEEDVKVKVSIPGLGVSATKYVDEIDNDDDVESEDVFLRLPECAEPGVYDVVSTVSYAEGHRTMVGSTKINVLKNEFCDGDVFVGSAPSKIVITAGSTFESVKPEETVVFPITVANNGRNSKSFSVLPVAGDWAHVQMSPTATAVISGGKSHTFYVFVTPQETASLGQKIVTASLSSSGELLEQIDLSVNVIGKEKSIISLKRALEIGLVVLLVLLIIVGLIVGFSMLRDDGNDDSPSQRTEPYY